MSARPFTVLVADDHEPTRAELERRLGADPRFEVCATAADAAGAITHALEQQPDLCLLDIRMPGNGIDAAWEIGARLPQSRIVMLTVSDNRDDLFTAIQAGATGYLLKDTSFVELPDLLAGVMDGQSAISPQLVTLLVGEFRRPEPRRRDVISTGRRERLTSREWQVLELLEQGLSTNDIAERLVISPVTIRSHVARIVSKAGASSRDEAIALFRLN